MTETTPVSALWRHNTITHVKSNDVITTLRDAVKAHDEDDLRILSAHEVGTHSIRFGAAMAMYLGGVPVFAIMMIGRWSSDAFMKYIRTIYFRHFVTNAHDATLSTVPNQPLGSSNITEIGGSASFMIGNEIGEGIIHTADQGSGKGMTTY